MITHLTEISSKHFDGKQQIELSAILDWIESSQMTDRSQIDAVDMEQHRLFVVVLKDIYRSLSTHSNINLTDLKKSKKQPKSSRWDIFRFLGLGAIPSTIAVGLMAFDLISNALFPFLLSTKIVLIVSILFAAIFLLCSHVIELLDAAKTFGIRFNTASDDMTLYMKEMNVLQSLRRLINKTFLQQDSNSLQEELRLLNLLNKRYEVLNEYRERLNLKMNKPIWQVGKIIATALGGVAAIIGGYCAGQSLALILLPSLTVFSWPIIVISLVVAAFALLSYSTIEKPMFDNLTSLLWGFDQENIANFCDVQQFINKKEKLITVTDNVSHCLTFFKPAPSNTQDTLCKRDSNSPLLNQ